MVWFTYLMYTINGWQSMYFYSEQLTQKKFCDLIRAKFPKVTLEISVINRELNPCYPDNECYDSPTRTSLSENLLVFNPNNTVFVTRKKELNATARPFTLTH